MQATRRQFAFYEQRGISVPGLTLLYLFNDLPEKTYFTIFNEKNKDLHQLEKDGIVGGPSIVFQRYHEKGVTKIRQTEYGETARPCGSIVDYDANTLYLWSLVKDMPTGWYKRRREENESARADGRGIVDVGNRTDGTLYPTSDQRSGEEDR